MATVVPAGREWPPKNHGQPAPCDLYGAVPLCLGIVFPPGQRKCGYDGVVAWEGVFAMRGKAVRSIA